MRHIENIFDSYKKELSKDKYDSITDRNKEQDLINRIINDPEDIEAFHVLVNANMRFVVYVLKEFNIPSLIPIMDIIQEGNIGLMIGIRRFDIKKYPDIKLFSYVVWWIRFFIRKALKLHAKYESKRAVLMDDEDLESSNRKSIANNEEYLSYHPELFAIGENVAMEDINRFLLEVLDEREAAIIRAYFGLGNNQEKTLEAIGQQMRLHFVRVRQLRDRALKKLQKSSENNDFLKYF